MPGLDDYGQLLRSGAASVPDYAADEVKKQLAAAQIGEVKAKLIEQQRAIADDEAFQGDLTHYLANPTAQGASMLVLRHPKHAEQLKTGFEMQDKAKQDSDFQAMSEVYSAASAGKNDVAAALMQRRIDGDKQAGQDTTHDQMIYDALSSGDPVQQKAALGMVGFTLSSIKPDKFNETYGSLTKDRGYTLAPGDKRFDENNQPVASVDAKPDFLVVPEGGKAIPLNSAASAVGTGGGGQSSPGAVATAAPGPTGKLDPKAFFRDFVSPHEGGYAAHDANGAPVNHGINQSANPDVNVADLTTDQAAQIFSDKYFKASGAADLPANLAAVHADTYFINPARAQQFLRASGGDPNKYMQMRINWMESLVAKDPGKYGKYQKAWANRNRDLTAYAGKLGGGDAAGNGGQPAPAQPGDVPGTVYGNPKPQARVLTPTEAQARGLDPAKVYEQHPDGTVSAVGDADKGSSTDGQELDDAATQYLLTGQMPALGMGSGGLKQQILRRRSDIMKRVGITAEQLPAFQAQYAADKKALTDNSALLSGLQSSENALKANGQQVWNTHRTLVSDGIIADNPWVTRQRLKYYENFGNPDQKAHVKSYLDAVNAYTQEYTKFMNAANGMGGSAAPSDASRQLAGELNDPGLAATPLLAHLRQGITEATNKRNGVAQQTQALQQKLSSYLHPHSGSTSQRSGAVQIHSAKEWYALKSGTPYIDPTGVHRTKK
jgi:hypothetical protein